VNLRLCLRERGSSWAEKNLQKKAGRVGGGGRSGSSDLKKNRGVRVTRATGEGGSEGEWRELKGGETSRNFKAVGRQDAQM